MQIISKYNRKSDFLLQKNLHKAKRCDIYKVLTDPCQQNDNHVSAKI